MKNNSICPCCIHKDYTCCKASPEDIIRDDFTYEVIDCDLFIHKTQMQLKEFNY